MFKLNQMAKSLSALGGLAVVSFVAQGSVSHLYSDAFSYTYQARSYTQRELDNRSQVMSKLGLREQDLPTLETSRAASCAVLRLNGQLGQVNYCGLAQ